MSKLFPMFKKKGKGKEEEIEEETKKKRRGKGKGKEEIISASLPSLSPSFSKAGKKKKKEKDGKAKDLSYGKENLLVPEMDEMQNQEFYIDDDGTVKIGGKLDLTSVDVSFEEVTDVQTEGDLEINVQIEEESTVTLRRKGSVTGGSTDAFECEEGEISRNSFDVVEGFSEDVFEASTEFFKDSSRVGEEEARTVDAIFAKESVSSEVSSHSEDPMQSNEESTLDDPVRHVDMNGNPEEQEFSDADKHSKYLDEDEMCTEDICEEKLMVVIPGKEEIPCTSESDTDENGNSEATPALEDQSKIAKDEETIDDQSLLSSQDSDEDFDSAQEDWDETDNVANKAKPSEEQSSLLNETQNNVEIEFTDKNKSSESIPVEAVNDSVNNGLDENVKDKGSREVHREISSGSSCFEDAGLAEDNFVGDLNSVVEACNNDIELDITSEKRNSLPRERLVRKLSGISTTSSDAFNEELDELLDEELDRLSEEEECLESEESQSMKTCQSSVGELLAGSPDASLSEDICKPLDVDHRVEAELNLESPEEKDIPEICEKITGIDNKSELVNDIERDDSKEIIDTLPPGENTSNVVVDTSPSDEGTNNVVIDTLSLEGSPSNVVIDTLPPEGSTTLKSSTSSPDISKTSLLNPDEGTESVKDSGYYSLPVSPKPGIDQRENKEPVSITNKGDDSFVDSEEEGMVTPPGETVSTKEDVTQEIVDTESNKPSLNSSDFDESTVLYQSCLESEADDSGKVNSLDNSLIEEQDNSEGLSSQTEKSNKSKGKNLELHIPQGVNTEFKEETCPSKLSTPTKNRLKSPIPENTPLKADSGSLTSPDPVGDRFLAAAVCQSHDEAEARLAQRRAARAEARELRLRELEKQQQDQENEEEKQYGTPTFAEPSPKTTVTTRTPLSRTGALGSAGQFSRRSSEDSTTDDSALPANVREMRAELKELDEKFRKAMITNAQLDNEKATLTFEVELMKDKYTELEETHTQLSKEHRKKCTEYEQLKKVATKLQEEVKALRSLLQERDALIQEYGLVVVGEEENGEADVPVQDEDDEFADMDDLTPRKIAVKKALLSQEAADLLSKGAAQDSLDVRLKKFGEEKKELEDQVRRLKLELEEEKNKNRRRKENGLDYDRQKEQNKTVNEYKFRVQKAEAEVSTLQANVARLDALSARYKTQSEELEKSEEELKSEKRRLQRELRDAQSRLEELESTNSHLIKRFDKLKNARSTLLKDLSQDPA